MAIHPLLTADLLHALASMGHGDEIAIVDANFPAISVGRRVIALPGADAPAALGAILTRVSAGHRRVAGAFTMEVVGDPQAVPEPVAAFARCSPSMATRTRCAAHLARQAFYARARSAFAVVRTGELRPYGNVLLVKGVVNRYP